MDKVLLFGEVVFRLEIKPKDFLAFFHPCRGRRKKHRHDARVLTNLYIAWVKLAHEERAHMRIDVAWLDAEFQCARHLEAHFAFDFIRRCVLNRTLHRAVDKAFFIVKSRCLLAGLKWTPAIVLPFTSQGQVEAIICIRVFTAILSNLWKPWTRHHDSGAGYNAFFHGFDGSDVDGMTHPDVIRMDHQELVRFLIAHALSKGWFACGTRAVNRNGHRRQLLVVSNTDSMHPVCDMSLTYRCACIMAMSIVSNSLILPAEW